MSGEDSEGRWVGENNTGFDPSLCGNLSEEYEGVFKRYEFWCEGVFFSGLGLCGNYRMQSTVHSHELNLSFY